MKHSLLLFSALIALTFASCKKDDSVQPLHQRGAVTASTLAFPKDSVIIMVNIPAHTDSVYVSVGGHALPCVKSFNPAGYFSITLPYVDGQYVQFAAAPSGDFVSYIPKN